MRRFPERLVRLIRRRTPEYTGHALDNRDRLGLQDEDVAAIAETAERWAKELDERRPGEFKYRMVGRDTHGRRMYTAGKELVYNGETVWYVLTIHEAE